MLNALLIKSEIEAAPYRARGEIINRYANQLGVSIHKIYKEMRRVAGPSKEIKREKKVSNGLVDAVAAIKVKGAMMGLGERELSTELCLEILINQGNKEAGTASVTTVNRRLRENGFREKDVIVRVEASYSNEQHQLDFSRSKYFQLWKFDSSAGDYILKVNRQLTYKENEHRMSTWVIGVTDAYSRVSAARAIPATGESALLGIDFLNFAYNRMEDDLPLRYIPDTLKTDNGSFIKAKSVKEMLNKLEIKTELVIPYKKRGIQKREAAWRMIWQRFELPLSIKVGDGKTITLEDYNDLMHECMIKLLEWKHPVKNETRGHVYRASLSANPPRTIDVDLREIAFNVIERTVSSDLVISINTEKFEAPDYTNGKRIRCYKNLAGEQVGELIDEFRKPFVLTPTDGFVKLGDYEHRAPATYRAGIEAQVKEEARSQKSGARVNYLPVREKAFKPQTKFDEVIEDEQFRTAYQAKVYIGSKLPRNETYEDYAGAFDPILEKQPIDKELIDMILNELKTRQSYG